MKNKKLTQYGIGAAVVVVVAVVAVYFGNTSLQQGSLSGLYNEQRAAAPEEATAPVAATPTQGTLSLARSNDASATMVASGATGVLVGSWSAKASGGDVTVKNLCLDVNPFPGNAKQLGVSDVTHATVVDIETKEVLFELNVNAGQLNGACELVPAAKPFVVPQGIGRNIGLLLDVSTGAPTGAKFMPLLGLENASPNFVTAGEITVK